MSAKLMAGARSSRILVDRICDHLHDRCSSTAALAEDFRSEPTADKLERLAPFHSDAMTDEYRAALLRLQAGTYGRCIACAGAIDVEHITVLPHARLCQACEERYSGAEAESGRGPGESAEPADYD